MSRGDNPLPVTLLSFKETPEVNKVNLNRITSTEIGGDYFTVEKSSNGIEFEKVAVIKMTGSNLLQNSYSAVDAYPFAGTTYYRLKMTSINGTFSYSKVIPVQMDASVNVSYSVFPNPTDPSQNVFLGVSGMEAGKEISVVISDILGKEIFEKNYAIGGQGTDHLNINPNMLLHSGLFIVIVKDASSIKMLFTQKLLIR